METLEKETGNVKTTKSITYWSKDLPPWNVCFEQAPLQSTHDCIQLSWTVSYKQFSLSGTRNICDSVGTFVCLTIPFYCNEMNTLKSYSIK